MAERRRDGMRTLALPLEVNYYVAGGRVRVKIEDKARAFCPDAGFDQGGQLGQCGDGGGVEEAGLVQVERVVDLRREKPFLVDAC